MRRQLIFQHGIQTIEPVHFVGKFFAARLLAIDEIAVDDAYIALRRSHGGTNHAGLFVCKTGDVFHHIMHWRTAQNRNAVVRFLPESSAVVAHGFKLFERKFFVG